MSTPRRETVLEKWDASHAMERYADGLRECMKTIDAAYDGLPSSMDFEGGELTAVRRMLEPLEREALEKAGLWARVAVADAKSRIAAAYLSALNALDTGAIRETQRREYEDAYLADKPVDPDDEQLTQRMLAELRETEELQQAAPIERVLGAGEDREEAPSL